MIVLMTDFGFKDPYVGIMKGVIKKTFPPADIIDLTHDIPSHNVKIANFVLKNSYRHFPKETIFVAVVDPGVGTAQRPLAIKSGNFFFVGPDNGLFGFLKEADFRMTDAVELTENRYYYRETPDSTFHGRDIFAPVAAHIKSGVPLNRLGTPVEEIKSIDTPACREVPGGVDIPLLHIDRFGNLIFSITREEFVTLTGGGKFLLRFSNQKIATLSENYQSEMSVIALFNSYGLLEIAAPSQSAADILEISGKSEKATVYATLNFR
ncbi:MAG: SAM-dependent chlorinase/fluorinase [Thermodesulfobacteriota bacterium]|nr:SAM-dependent chlorinase/fluorinase [Thermodesulfobacteriota bacterium]